MVDILRWGMEEDYPVSVNSVGGRFRYQDDWETPDTQVISMNFADGKSMTWEGRSCNGRTVEGAEVGAMFYGEKGSLLITGSNGYTIYDLKNNLVKEEMSGTTFDQNNLVNPTQSLDVYHIDNLCDAIRKGTPLNADIVSGHKSTLLVQVGQHRPTGRTYAEYRSAQRSYPGRQAGPEALEPRVREGLGDESLIVGLRKLRSLEKCSGGMRHGPFRRN